MNASALPTNYRIDINSASTNAYSTLSGNWRLAIEMAWLPYVIIFGLEAFGFLIGGGGTASSVLQGLGGGFGFIVFGTVFYARWYRFLLRGELPSRQLFTPAWQALLVVSFKFVALLFFGALVLLAIGRIPPYIIFQPLALIAAIGLAVAATRVSLIFPAAALEQPILFRTAWQLMSGNFWRLFVCAFLCSVPFAIVEGVLNQAAGGKVSLTVMALGAADLAVEFAGMAVLAALFSEVYRGIVGVSDAQLSGDRR